MPSAADLSLLDNVKFNLKHVIPYYLGGPVVANRRWVAIFTKFHRDLAAVRTLSRLRDKYGSEYLYLYVVEVGANRLPRFTRTLAVLNHDGIREIYSDPDTFAVDADFKRERLSLSQPGALTISSGAQAHRRRRFNEAVLDTREPEHRYARRFLEIVDEEVAGLIDRERLVWSDFARIAERITVRVVLGTERGDVSRTLDGMLKLSTRAFRFGRSKHFHSFHRELEEHVRNPVEGSLAFLCAHADSDEDTRVTSQMTFWLFVIKDALEIHVPRALALIAAHADAAQRVREELVGKDLSDPGDVYGLERVRGCVHEAVRLWSATPMLFRHTTKRARLADIDVPPSTQILIHPAFNQRDVKHYGRIADEFAPDQWTGGGTPEPPMNHFNNGPRECAGKALILFLSSAVLAKLLARNRYLLKHPVLDRGARLPYLYNQFALELDRTS